MAEKIEPEVKKGIECLEPHEWNARLAASQKAKGQKPNIAKPPMMQGHEMRTTPPEVE